KTCAVCHGDAGNGGTWTSGMALKPRDFTTTPPSALSRATMIDVVTKGRPGTPMVSYASQLQKQDIEAVVDYVRATFMQAPPEISGLSGTYAHGTPPAPAVVTPQLDMKAPFANGLKGDPKRGGDFYMHNCLTCHGAGGQGDGPRAYFINPKPANFHLPQYRERLNRPALYAAIRDGKQASEMPAWGKVLTPQQLADVGEFVFQSFIAPQASTKKKS
ncbi:MAG TPA: cytochrome c, partial [Gammaproteobacteria bacterium]